MARPRKPWYRKPWYRKPRDTWFVEIDGKQVPLAKGEHNRAAAEKEFHRLVSLRDEPDPSIPRIPSSRCSAGSSAGPRSTSPPPPTSSGDTS